MWKKTDSNLIMKDEAPEAMAAIYSAKNNLSSRVFGCVQRLPGFDAPVRLISRTGFCDFQA